MNFEFTDTNNITWFICIENNYIVCRTYYEGELERCGISILSIDKKDEIWEVFKFFHPKLSQFLCNIIEKYKAFL